MAKSMLWMLAVLCVGGGCAGPIATRFRVVDAVYGHPIQGVATAATWGLWQPAAPGLFPVYVRFPTRSEMSDQTGLVQLQSPANEVEFSSPGYIPCSIASGWNGYKQRGKFFDLNTMPWEDEKTVLVRLKPLKQ